MLPEDMGFRRVCQPKGRNERSKSVTITELNTGGTGSLSGIYRIAKNALAFASFVTGIYTGFYVRN